MPLRTSKALAALTLIFAATAALAADPGLVGRGVTFQVITYDDPAQLLFQGGVHHATIGPGAEFGLTLEGAQNDIDVVPVLVDISDGRIELSYANAEPGDLWTARFNGYVLTFQGKCAPVTRARVDPAATNVEFDNKRVSIDGNRLLLNVSALHYDRDSRIAVNLTLADCAAS